MSLKTTATTVEALLGAVYLDVGRDALVSVLTVLGLIHPLIPVVTFTILILILRAETTLISTLTKFLDRDVGGQEIDREVGSGPSHARALPASDGYRQPSQPL